jgi:hypothetical protein
MVGYGSLKLCYVLWSKMLSLQCLGHLGQAKAFLAKVFATVLI